jgi:D-alanyl-D-alanine carboxypeptidase (penicillin-binding protein 5/6)
MLGISRGAHRRRNRGAQEGLRALGQRVAPSPGASGFSSRRGWGPRPAAGLGRYVVALVVVAIVIFVAVQLLRPLPSASFRSTQAGSIHLPGTAPALPWPSSGAAAMSEVGIGSLGSAGTTQAVPIASIAKVLTAYVVLQDHPLSLGSQGPAITVPPDVAAAYQSGVVQGQSEVAVTAGETLTEYQALQGLLIASGNDIATLLGEWDAGNTTAFVAKLNTAAKTLGLTSTRITDPSGLDAGTVSSAADLVRLGEEAMAVPVFRQIVGTPAVTLPQSGLIYNYDYDLGHDGIVGIKTGSDGAAGGCFLFEAQQTVSGQKVTLVGVVLGQTATPMLTTALDQAESLVQAAFANVRPVPVVPPGQRVGSVVAQWGASVPVTVPVTVPSSSTVLAVPGISLQAKVHRIRLGSSVAGGARVGTITVVTSGHTVVVPLRTTAALSGPSLWWRLTHF